MAEPQLKQRGALMHKGNEDDVPLQCNQELDSLSLSPTYRTYLKLLVFLKTCVNVI